MKVAIAQFLHETNTFNPILTVEKNFVYHEGQDMIDRCFAKDFFVREGIEMVPTIIAHGTPSGLVSEKTYLKYVHRMIALIEEAEKLDGIFLHLHGAMEVENIGSGELYLVRKIRERVGFDMPIGLALDPHGNNDEKLADYVNVIRAYRTIPHLDQKETCEAVASHLVHLIRTKELTRPQLISLPISIQGEKAVSEQEPLRSIFRRLEF